MTSPGFSLLCGTAAAYLLYVAVLSIFVLSTGMQLDKFPAIIFSFGTGIMLWFVLGMVRRSFRKMYEGFSCSLALPGLAVLALFKKDAKADFGAEEWSNGAVAIASNIFMPIVALHNGLVSGAGWRVSILQGLLAVGVMVSIASVIPRDTKDARW